MAADYRYSYREPVRENSRKAPDSSRQATTPKRTKRGSPVLLFTGRDVRGHVGRQHKERFTAYHLATETVRRNALALTTEPYTTRTRAARWTAPPDGKGS